MNMGNVTDGAGLINNSNWSMQQTKIPLPSQSIMLFDFQLSSNWMSISNWSSRRASDIYSEIATADFWTHGTEKLNFLMADGSAKGMKFWDTISSPDSPEDTIWDCSRKD